VSDFGSGAGSRTAVELEVLGEVLGEVSGRRVARAWRFFFFLRLLMGSL